MRPERQRLHDREWSSPTGTLLSRSFLIDITGHGQYPSTIAVTCACHRPIDSASPAWPKDREATPDILDGPAALRVEPSEPQAPTRGRATHTEPNPRELPPGNRWGICPSFSEMRSAFAVFRRMTSQSALSEPQTARKRVPYSDKRWLIATNDTRAPMEREMLHRVRQERGCSARNSRGRAPSCSLRPQ